MAVQQIKGTLIPCGIAASQIEVDPCSVIIGDTLNRASTDAKESGHGIGCARADIAETAPVHMLLLNEWQGISPVPPAKFKPAGLRHFFAVRIFQVKHQLHGVYIIKGKQPPQD